MSENRILDLWVYGFEEDFFSFTFLYWGAFAAVAWVWSAVRKGDGER